MKNLKKIIYVILLAFLSCITILILLSPYKNYDGFEYPLIKSEIEIDAPVSKVFKYLAVSANAGKWSVFVNHINVLNADSVKDGTQGCRRRCFKTTDENGLQWDETITVVEPDHLRQLTIYNMKKFPMKADHLATEQIYEETDDMHCKLALTLFFNHHKPSATEWFKTKLAAWKIKSIFYSNLQNIKKQIEND